MKMNSRCDNRGLSLIEIMVAVAVMAIAGIAIAGFMVTGARSYTTTSSEINLQYEAQIAMNQIGDFLIDATEGVTYEADGAVLVKDDPAVDYAQKNLYIYSSRKDAAGAITYYADVITWKKADQKLYYSKYDVTKSGDTYTLGSATVADQLMTDYVAGFSPDLSFVTSENRFHILLNFEKGTKTYSSSSNVTLRNTLAVNRKAPGGSVSGPTVPVTVTGVDIVQGDIILAPGGAAQFTAIVRGTGSPSQAVTWSVDTTMTDAGTGIDASGKLTVAAGETHPQFQVTARSVADSSQSDTVTVFVKKVEGIVISGGPDKIYKGSTFTLTATVTGKNIGTNDQDVRWRILEGSSYVTLSGSGNFKVAQNAPEGLRVSIRAYPAMDASISAEWTKTISAGNPDGGGEEENPGIQLEGPDEINRNGSGLFRATLTNGEGKSVRFDVKVESEGKEYGRLVYSTDVNGNECRVNISSLLEFDADATVTVTASVQGDSGTSEGASVMTRTAVVPHVSIQFKGSNEPDTNWNRTLNTKAYYLQTRRNYDYRLKGIENAGKLKWNLATDSDMYKAYQMLNVTEGNEKISLAVPSLQVKGTVTVTPAIGAYKMEESIITVKVAGGNITDPDGTYYYLPDPDDSEFPAYGMENSSQVQPNSTKDHGYWAENPLGSGVYGGYVAPIGDANMKLRIYYCKSCYGAPNGHGWIVYIFDSSKPWVFKQYSWGPNDTEWK